MEDKAFSILKYPLSKHLLTTLTAILVGIAAIIITPESYWVVQKAGFFLYFIGVTISSFLIIRLLNFSLQIASKQLQQRKKIRQFSYEMDEAIMTFFDKCDSKKRKLAYDLIASGNHPIQYRYFPWVLDWDEGWRAKLNYTKLANGTFLIKFKDDIFEQVLVVYTAHGRISHFEQEQPITGQR